MNFTPCCGEGKKEGGGLLLHSALRRIWTSASSVVCDVQPAAVPQRRETPKGANDSILCARTLSPLSLCSTQLDPCILQAYALAAAAWPKKCQSGKARRTRKDRGLLEWSHGGWQVLTALQQCCVIQAQRAGDKCKPDTEYPRTSKLWEIPRIDRRPEN